MTCSTCLRLITIVDIGTERLTAQAGDFFVDPLPAADAYILMEVIHDWPDVEAAAILRAIRRAARDDATVLIIEGVIDEQRPDPRVHTLDVVMLPSPEAANVPPTRSRSFSTVKTSS